MRKVRQFPSVQSDLQDLQNAEIVMSYVRAIANYHMTASYMPGPNGYGPPTQYYPGQDMYGGVLPSQSRAMGAYGPAHVYDPHDLPMAQRLAMQGTQPSGMFTRNLIGSLAASAFRLTDPLEKIGIWFILQDLSVRTEGNFR